MQTSFDAIVVGAGPAGATAAILLARAGWSVALIEKQSFPRRKVCGECIAASNFALLDALGVGVEFDFAAGPALRRVALMQGQRTIVAALPATGSSRDSFGRALGREKLDTMLLAVARDAGATIFQPWALESVEGDPGDFSCTVRAQASGERMTLNAPVLIAANGSWEPLPSARAHRRLQRRPSDLLAFKANFRESRLADGLLPVLSFEGGYGGMVVADDGVTTLACCIRADRLEQLRRNSPGMRAGEVVEAALMRECAGVMDAMGTAWREGEWLAAGPLAPGIRLREDDKFLRIGNAAGEAHPIIGEGMSMAMQSAWLLSANLLTEKRHREVIGDPAWHRNVRHRYQAEWRQHFIPRLRLAAIFAHLAMRPSVSAPLVTMLGFVPAVLTYGATVCGKIRCAVSLERIALLSSGCAPKH